MDVCMYVCMFIAYLLICVFAPWIYETKEKKLDEFPMIASFHQRQRTMPIFIKAPEHIPLYNTIQYRTYCTPEEKRSKYIELVKKDEEMQTFLNQFEATKKEGWYCENNTILYNTILYKTFLLSKYVLVVALITLEEKMCFCRTSHTIPYHTELDRISASESHIVELLENISRNIQRSVALPSKSEADEIKVCFR